MISTTLRAATLFLVLAYPAFAGTPAIQNWSGDNSNDFPGFGSVGWQFDVTSEVSVDALGLFDWGQDGFATSQQVAIWDDTGSTIFAQATITSTSAFQGAVVQGGRFRYESITPVTLPVGRYRIGASAGATVERWAQDFSTPSLVTAPEISWVSAALLTGTTTFGFPSLVNGGPTSVSPGVFGPNFTVLTTPGSTGDPDEAAVIPTMPVTALFALVALVGVMGAYARKRR